MICPKCGFSQPDDIYCALCGINIERYALKKRKRHFKAGALVILMGMATLAVANYFMSSPEDLPERIEHEGIRSAVHATRQRTSTEKKTPRNRSKIERPENGFLENQPSEDAHAPLQSPPQESQGEAKDESPGERSPQTAAQWFEKGRRLDDDSDAEIEYYQQAKKLDPEFVPAAFRLGAIYSRQAKHELADREFAHFLTFASDSDRQAYDIYEFYSLADVERLFERVDEQVAAGEKEKGSPSESAGETKEELSGEVPEEETSEGDGEPSTEETSEEVLTVVKFSSINGHIVVPVVLNDSLVTQVLVDTGAGITILSKVLAEELGVEEEPGRSITLKTMAMDVEASLGRLDSIQVGNLSRNNFQVAITDMPLGQKSNFNGILGMDFMNNYTIQIDNKNQRLTLTSKSP